MHNKLKNHWLSFLVFICVIVIVQTIGSIFTIPNIERWYLTVQHPFWTPPNWVFGPVWSILYIMIAVSGWLIWISLRGTFSDKIKNKAFIFYVIQLLLNFAWSPLFFYYHEMTWALVDIILMIVFVMLTIKTAWSINKKAAQLLIPYLLWICYAFSLNAGFVYLN